jgi:hypothetical protein
MCTPCSDGEYQDLTGQTSCKTCSNYQDKEGETKCLPCPSGSNEIKNCNTESESSGSFPWWIFIIIGMVVGLVIIIIVIIVVLLFKKKKKENKKKEEEPNIPIEQDIDVKEEKMLSPKDDLLCVEKFDSKEFDAENITIPFEESYVSFFFFFVFVFVFIVLKMIVINFVIVIV